jgi:hypothetical protein
MLHDFGEATGNMEDGSFADGPLISLTGKNNGEKLNLGQALENDKRASYHPSWFDAERTRALHFSLKVPWKCLGLPTTLKERSFMVNRHGHFQASVATTPLQSIRMNSCLHLKKRVMCVSNMPLNVLSAK